MSDDKEPSIGVKVDEEFKREIRIAAAKRDESMSDFVRRALRAEVDGEHECEGNPMTAVVN